MIYKILSNNGNPVCAEKWKHAYANRLDLDQSPSNWAAGLRSYLFATQTISPRQNQTDFQGFELQTIFRSIFRK